MNGKSERSYSSFHNLLEQSVRGGLQNLIGESASKAMLINFKLLDHQDQLHNILYPFFGQGTLTIEKAIIKELFGSIGERYEHFSGTNFDYQLCVSFARKIFEEKKVLRS
jgi:hypothetical protein